MLVIDNPHRTLHLAILIIPFFFFFHFRYWISFVSRATIRNTNRVPPRPDDFIGSILCYITLHDIAGESGFINHSNLIDSFGN